MRNLMLAVVAWTAIALGALLLIPYQLPPGCGNLGHLTAECIASTNYLETHFPWVLYRYPIITLALGYVVLVGFALLRRRRRKTSPTSGDIAER